MLADYFVHVGRCEMLKARPAIVCVRTRRPGMVIMSLRKQSPLDRRLETRGLQLFECLELIQPLDEEQVSDLLDNFEWIGNPGGTKSIPDLIYLVTDLVCQHNCSLDRALSNRLG